MGKAVIYFYAAWLQGLNSICLLSCPYWFQRCNVLVHQLAEFSSKDSREREKNMRKQKGFSLIELLIVVAIILIIAAIAIPNLLRSRIAANEASAVGSIRSINTAQVSYASTYPDVGFAKSLTELGTPAAGCAKVPDSTSSCLLDSVLGCAAQPCTKSGYKFNSTGDTKTTPAPTYTADGSPVTPGQTGQRGFFSDTSGVIRFDADGTTAAAATDKALQ
jgi:type IV pilus assembly protein PilA